MPTGWGCEMAHWDIPVPSRSVFFFGRWARLETSSGLRPSLNFCLNVRQNPLKFKGSS